jgi:hypothetical protein
LSSTPEDLTAPSDVEGVRIDAPPAPGSSASVTSGPGPAAPPRRARNKEAPAMVSASIPAEAFEPADPIDVAAAAELTDADPTDEAPRRVRRPKRTRSSQGARPTMAPRNERQFRQTVVKVDLWSVTKLSLCFYLSAMFVTLVALIALWVIADAAGVIGSIEKFLGELLSAEKGTFQFLSAEVLRGTILIGLVVVALQVVVTVVAASFYNIFSELFGGLEITVKEEETSPRQ